ncbi:MAG: hypothetical protein KDD53_08410, partial [Bdellovibrionales bacterium]|nr:hypothetical protein [Bdellovibrionales bacterium]
NPDLKVTAEIAIGESSNTMARTLAGDYEGDIIAEEVPVTYLNQGYIDRTARDPSKVETLLKERMDTSSLEEAEEGVATVVSKLSRHRNAYLKRATLLRERTVIKGRLAAANKFFEISNSDEYKKLNERRQVLATKYSGMRSALEGVKELENVFDTYRDSVESIEIDTDVAAKLFPSLDLTKLKAIVNFPSTSLRELGQIRGAIEKSPELDGVIKEGKQLSADIAKLFEKEKISYTPKMFDEKQKELQLYQGQQRTNDAAIAAAESNEAEFTGVLDELSTRLAEREAARKVSMDDFNQGLTNVEVRYDEVGAEDWLVDVLTNGAKDAWDQYTPEEEKQVSRFRKPSEEDVRTMIATLANDERSIDEVRLHLIDCLDKDEIPTGQGHEYLKWLFGDKSVVIKDFLRLRLREYVPVGQIGLYYKEKNIAKEGLSYTERCGALLEILLEKGVEPIIIDQPEDNLGSTYITATLIPTILRKKHSRQIILISHNPNTVVLADSDLVIAFDRDGDDDGIDLHTGAIESAEIKDIICDIIEGGVDAFKLRSERYQLG